MVDGAPVGVGAGDDDGATGGAVAGAVFTAGWSCDMTPGSCLTADGGGAGFGGAGASGSRNRAGTP